MMAAPRKRPPSNIDELIERYVADEGGSIAILARAIGVSATTVRKWFDGEDYPELKEKYECAREAHMHRLYLELLQMSRAGKGNIAGLIFTLKAKFKQYDMPQSGKLIDVAVNVPQPVMIVRDHGSDEEWQRKAEEQQRKLLAEAQTISARLPEPQDAPETSREPVIDVFPVPAPVAVPMPIHAPAWRQGT
jgi:hypothetical protein